MKHGAIDAVFGHLFSGEPVTPGETWPRLDAFTRRGEPVIGVPSEYQVAIDLFEIDPVLHGQTIGNMLVNLCKRSDPAGIRTGIAAWTPANAPAA